MKYPLAFVTSLIVSLIVTPLVIKLAGRLGIIDRPVDDRWHKKSTPRMGGVAIFIGFIVASAIFASFQREMLIVLLGGIGVFILGFLDDKFGTFPKTKSLVQIIIASVLVLLGIRLKILPTAAAVPLTILWIVGLTNALNMIVNMDGLSSGIAFVAAIAIFLLSWQSGQTTVPILALALAGACLGFLRYNFKPAKIFMGDCGSLLIGYTLSTLTILGFWQESSAIFPALTAPVLILGYPVFDTTFVTILRLESGGRPWVGGKDHSSHRLVKLGLNERQVVLLVYAFGIVGGLAAFVLLNTTLVVGISVAAFLCMAAIVFGWFLAKLSKDYDNGF